jgi:hypothetical protein
MQQGRRIDTPSQRWFWQVAWKVNKQANAKGTWNSASLIQKFTSPQQELFFGAIDKHVSRRWADSVPKDPNDAREVVLKSTTFGIVKEGKNTKVRLVNDCTGTNMRSPPAPNSQLSTVGAVRGNLQKGMVVHQRDLDQAFMQIHVKIEDEKGKKATLRIRPRHGAQNRPYDFRARNWTTRPL